MPCIVTDIVTKHPYWHSVNGKGDSALTKPAYVDGWLPWHYQNERKSAVPWWRAAATIYPARRSPDGAPRSLSRSRC